MSSNVQIKPLPVVEYNSSHEQIRNQCSNQAKGGCVNGEGDQVMNGGIVEESINGKIVEEEPVTLSREDLQLFEHQVSGHGTAEKGLLKHKLGYVLKPLQGPPMGLREVNFYKQIFSSTYSKKEDCYSKLEEFVPRFHGIAQLQQGIISNGDSTANGPIDPKRYLMLDDILRGYKKPCVVDLKLGPRTWSPDATEAKIKQEKGKYKGTKFVIGICLTGMFYHDVHKNFEKCRRSKEFCKSLNPDSMKQTLKEFFNHDEKSNTYPLSGILVGKVYEKLEKLLEIFETQKSFRLYGSSVLVAYDADYFQSALSNQETSKLELVNDAVPFRLMMIDFAHFHPAEYDSLDENYLFGLRNLIKIICDIAENK